MNLKKLLNQPNARWVWYDDKDNPDAIEPGTVWILNTNNLHVQKLLKFKWDEGGEET